VLVDLQIAYQEWQGTTQETSKSTSPPVVEEGLLNRIAGFIRGVQEV